MKGVRLVGFFLLSVIVVTTAFSFFMPVSQKITRSITINASADTLYSELIKLENFNHFSVWGGQDSSLKYTLSGTDGTVGASSAWKGSPEISGEGMITIAALEVNKKVAHTISFSQPKKGTAKSSFLLTEKEKNTTELTWDFEMVTPRPWNIFNLFFSLDKQMGSDFEKGLAAIKLAMEAKAVLK
jgi:hypothetical protein